MHFTERFTKVDANTVNYEVTSRRSEHMDCDPGLSPFPGNRMIPIIRKPEDLYEYACHEGNYRMMEDTLTGSRALKEAQEVAK